MTSEVELWHAPQALAQVEKRHLRGLPLLDPEEDLHISDPAFRKAQRCASLPVARQEVPGGQLV